MIIETKIMAKDKDKQTEEDKISVGNRDLTKDKVEQAAERLARVLISQVEHGDNSDERE